MLTAVPHAWAGVDDHAYRAGRIKPRGVGKPGQALKSGHDGDAAQVERVLRSGWPNARRSIVGPVAPEGNNVRGVRRARVTTATFLPRRRAMPSAHSRNWAVPVSDARHTPYAACTSKDCR